LICTVTYSILLDLWREQIVADRSRFIWEHDHVFGQDRRRPGERRTLIVIAITAITMVVEIAAGIAFGSMALLADGLHMGSHAVALGVAAAAYIYARRHARDARYSFGTGKVNALGGFAGAILLGLFAFLMVWESIGRFIEPVPIEFNQAILVAVIGLLVNAVSVVILGGHHHGAGHDHGGGHDPGHSHDPADAHHHRHADHNLRSAYLHVLADALTSVLAILALLSGKYLGWAWMDPVMGVVGAILVARWSFGLLRMTGHVLLDRQGPAEVRGAIQAAVESENGDRVCDLHVWAIGPDLYAAVISVVSASPRTPDEYKARIPRDLRVAHVTVEVNHLTGPSAS